MPWRPGSVLVLVGTTLAAACGPEGPSEVVVFDPCEPVSLAIERNLQPGELEAVREGAAMWNQALGARLGADPGGQELVVEFEDAAPMFFGVYEPARGRIVINERLEGERARAITVAHEIGHAFGLAHVADRESVMNVGNRSRLINEDDVRAVQALWGECAPVLDIDLLAESAQ